MADEAKKRLTAILQKLSPEQASALLEFAEFLLLRQGVSSLESARPIGSQEVPKPRVIPRPAEETVIRAVKRLRATYPMLDPRKLLNQTSELMTQHIVQGREAVEVIEELEVLFRTHYEKMAEQGVDNHREPD